jgi:GPI-anchor transamidase subunit U
MMLTIPAIVSYLLNPYVFLSTISLSTTALDNMLLLFAVMFAAEGTALPRLTMFASSFIS